MKRETAYLYLLEPGGQRSLPPVCGLGTGILKDRLGTAKAEGPGVLGHRREHGPRTHGSVSHTTLQHGQ